MWYFDIYISLVKNLNEKTFTFADVLSVSMAGSFALLPEEFFVDLMRSVRALATSLAAFNNITWMEKRSQKKNSWSQCGSKKQWASDLNNNPLKEFRNNKSSRKHNPQAFLNFLCKVNRNSSKISSQLCTIFLLEMKITWNFKSSKMELQKCFDL